MPVFNDFEPATPILVTQLAEADVVDDQGEGYPIAPVGARPGNEADPEGSTAARPAWKTGFQPPIVPRGRAQLRQRAVSASSTVQVSVSTATL